jgi:outer membrane protein assembly factor BamD
MYRPAKIGKFPSHFPDNQNKSANLGRHKEDNFLVLSPMNKRIIIFFLAIAALLLFASCNKEYRTYAKYSRKGSISEKDSAAFFYYRNGDYEKASYLFEELQSAYRGSARAKDILYHYAYSKFNFGLYVVSAYYFDQYAKLYPADEKTPECTFMVGESYYREAAPYYLDQDYTRKAISQFQLYINNYPLSDQVKEANRRMTELRERLAMKSFETAKLYYKLESYKAAVTSFQVMMQEYPDSRYYEEAMLYLMKASFNLAEISVPSKKKNRYLDALDYYERFVDRYPSSVHAKEAESYFDKIKKALGRYSGEESK